MLPPNTKEVQAARKKLHNKEIRNLDSLQQILQVKDSKTERVARTETMRSAYYTQCLYRRQGLHLALREVLKKRSL